MAQYVTRDSNGWVRWEGKPRLYLWDEDTVEFDDGHIVHEAIKKPKGWPDLEIGQIVRIKETISVDGDVQSPKPRKYDG